MESQGQLLIDCNLVITFHKDLTVELSVSRRSALKRACYSLSDLFRLAMGVFDEISSRNNFFDGSKSSTSIQILR